ncbi:MAG TPA: hypothetical protein VNJ47_08520 [Nevskiales bacterium]|nr:hypothetical protein [Nevskiales bacterium]
MLKRTACAALLAQVLAGCTAGSGDAGPSGGAGETGFPQDAPAQANASLGCSWALVSDPDLGNIAFPDEYASYWVAVLPALPGTRLRIEGQFPDARYFSYNVYDPLLRPVDAVTDYQLLPRVPGSNPWRSAGAAPGADYVAYLRPEPQPEVTEPNTLSPHPVSHDWQPAIGHALHAKVEVPPTLAERDRDGMQIGQVGDGLIVRGARTGPGRTVSRLARGTRPARGRSSA